MMIYALFCASYLIICFGIFVLYKPSTSEKKKHIEKKGNTCFITDAEGNLDWFKKQVEYAEGIEFDETGALQFTNNFTKFVYGGDAVDKGDGDERIVNSLVDFQKRFPKRVFLLIGNRDANKLRFASELSSLSKIIFDNINYHYWLKPEDSYSSWLTSTKKEDIQWNRLIWILSKSMGAAGAEERRRKELKDLGRSSTDDDVINSFFQSVQSSGFMLEYLMVAQIAVIVDDVLYVHGAVDDKTIGYVPGIPTHFADAREWVSQLNEWSARQVLNFRYDIRENGNRPGEALMDYGLPGGNGGKTVVYNNWLDNGNGKVISKGVSSYLNIAGIGRVVTGHQPHGDVVNCIRETECDKDAIQVFSADTSYSDMNKDDNRGQVYFSVSLHTDGKTFIRGVRSDGMSYYHMISTKNGIGDPYIGKQDKEGYWVKTILSSNKYLLVKGEGRRLHEKTVSADKIEFHIQ